MPDTARKPCRCYMYSISPHVKFFQHRNGDTTPPARAAPNIVKYARFAPGTARTLVILRSCLDRAAVYVVHQWAESCMLASGQLVGRCETKAPYPVLTPHLIIITQDVRSIAEIGKVSATPNPLGLAGPAAPAPTLKLDFTLHNQQPSQPRTVHTNISSPIGLVPSAIIPVYAGLPHDTYNADDYVTAMYRSRTG